MRAQHLTLVLLASVLLACQPPAEPDVGASVEAICCGAACCLIDSVCYARNDTNPANSCEICDPSSSQTSWTMNPTCVDAGPPPLVDAGPSGVDAGPSTGSDAGPSTGSDAGPSGGSDAGPSGGSDAGPSGGSDAGPPSGGDAGPGGSEDGGCAAASGRPGSGLPLVLVGFGLVALAIRRRRV